MSVKDFRKEMQLLREKAQQAGRDPKTVKVGLDAVEWYAPYPAQRAFPQSFTLEEGVVWSMDVLFYGEEVGPFHFENQLIPPRKGPRSCYAPATTPTVLPKGLAVEVGSSLSWYCPGEVRLEMEEGILEPFGCLFGSSQYACR